MASAWDLPPTPEEMHAAGASWDAPPTAEEMQAAGHAPPDALESGARGLANGATFGFAPALAGAGSALIDELKGDKRSFGDAYRAERDDSRHKFEEAQKANPTAYGVGNVAGGLASGLALTPLTGGASLGGAIGAGALAGGLQGAGEATSSGEDVGQGVVDTLKGAGLGGIAGLGGAVGGKALGMALKKVAPGLSGALDNASAAQARRLLRAGPEVDNAALLRAVDEGGIEAGDTVQTSAKRLAALRKGAGEETDTIASHLNAIGAAEPGNEGAKRLATQLYAKADEIERNSTGSDLPALYRKHADDMLAHTGKPEGISLEQLRNMRQTAQSNAQAEYRKAALGVGSKPHGDALKDIASTYRDAEKYGIKAAQYGDDADAAALSKAYEPAMARNSDLIAASTAANAAAKNAARNRGIGVTDMIAAAAGFSHGPLGIVAPVANHLARTRGASTAAVALHGMSGKVARLAATNPAALGTYGGILSRALVQSPEKFATVNFILAKDPKFQQHVQSLPDEKDNE